MWRSIPRANNLSPRQKVWSLKHFCDNMLTTLSCRVYFHSSLAGLHIFTTIKNGLSDQCASEDGFPHAGIILVVHGIFLIRTLLPPCFGKGACAFVFQLQFSTFSWVITQGLLLPGIFIAPKMRIEVCLADKKITNGIKEGNEPQGLVNESGRLLVMCNRVCK